MRNTVPVSVIIPTYNRGVAVVSVVEKIKQCDPVPQEILIHVDLADGTVEHAVTRRFPDVRVLTSTTRLGPGGGRHRCLLACMAPLAVGFDDDSYPIDSDFFSTVQRLFHEYPRAAVLQANIWHRNEPPKVRSEAALPISTYIACGYGIRLAAYRQVRGHLPRPVAYGMEENDLSIQFFVRGWDVIHTDCLRVFHDTELKHHESAEITSGVITNVALFAFLHYPSIAWGRGLAQLTNIIWDSIRKRRLRGILSGIARIPTDCYRNRHHRNPVPRQTLKKYLHFRRTGSIG
jgi:glycosyltransferase involved in cell wall biosynthesis